MGATNFFQKSFLPLAFRLMIGILPLRLIALAQSGLSVERFVVLTFPLRRRRVQRAGGIVGGEVPFVLFPHLPPAIRPVSVRAAAGATSGLVFHLPRGLVEGVLDAVVFDQCLQAKPKACKLTKLPQLFV